MSLTTLWPKRIDGLILGTHAHALEDLRGLNGHPDRRHRPVEPAFVAGEIPDYDVLPRARERRLQIWVRGRDADGVVTHPSGPMGHVVENMKLVDRILAKHGSAIAYEQDVPTSAGATETLTGDCQCVRRVEVEGDWDFRRLDVTLRFPYPYLHGPLITSNGNSGSFTISTAEAVAPIFDMTILFKNGTDPRLTVNEGPLTGQYVQWIGSPGASGVEIKPWLGTVRQLPGGSDVIGGLRHNLALWMVWPAGDSSLSLTLTGGGTVDLSYWPGR